MQIFFSVPSSFVSFLHAAGCASKENSPQAYRLVDSLLFWGGESISPDIFTQANIQINIFY
jgi:hypothetical protein